MYFDDRLGTVMGQPALDPHDRAVRWRQLVELAARAVEESSLLQAALTMIRAERPSIAPPVRAAALRAVAGRPMSPAVLASLAAGEDRATTALLVAGASFDEAGWSRVAELGGPDIASCIAAIHGRPVPAAGPAPALPPAPLPPVNATTTAPAMPSIDDMLARIERLRTGLIGASSGEDDEKEPASLRDTEWEQPAAATLPSVPAPQVERPPAAGGMTPSPTPPAPMPAEPSYATQGGPLFRWECDASGEVAWVQGIPRAVLVGFNLSRDESGDYVSPALGQAFARRSPFHDAPLTLPGEGAGAGRWALSGTPLFEPVDGRFLGYRGVARRPDAPAASRPQPAPRQPQAAPSSALPDSGSLRELVHEIRTPLNAIIGFAEIIDGQYLGPAHRRYRERAADIVVQARTLLSALEDLDLAAKLQAGQSAEEKAHADLEAIVPALFADLASRAAREQVELEVGAVGSHRCPLQPDLVERLIRRFVSAVIDEAEPGERLRVATTRRGASCWLVIDRPRRTHGLVAAELLDPAFGSGGARDAGHDDGEETLLPQAGRRLGLGFQLRMVRGLARLAGGDLEVDAEGLVLLLPTIAAD